MTIETYKKYFADVPSHKQMAKYATIFVMRVAESECIFRTDGELNTEITRAGVERNDLEWEFTRVFMSKRKGKAPERRLGRAILRKYGLLNKNAENKECMINENMCGKCIDCYLYGSAVGNDVSLNAHVVGDEAFDLLPSTQTTTIHTFNALYESGNMRSGEDGHQSQAIQKDQVVKSGTIFMDMETVKDVTSNEFLYVLANIVRNKRYGAQSSVLGKMNNVIVGIVFSNCELFSNLEWTQHVYDAIAKKLKTVVGKTPEFPLDPKTVKETATTVMNDLLKTIHGEILVVPDTEVTGIIKQMSNIYGNDALLKTFLTDMDVANKVREPVKSTKSAKKESAKKSKSKKYDEPEVTADAEETESK